MASILVVDDSLLLRNIIKNELIFRGFQIVGEAQNGNEAIAMFEKLRPDLVTMDITMDGKNGLDAAEEILKKHPTAKIIMVSALGEDAILSKAVKIGVKDFIVKPFEPERLHNAVEKALK